jgi:branched-chain amino acid aminotransferase
MAARVIHLDGKLVPYDEAKIHVFSPAVRFGAHLFEGIRAYWNAAADELFVFRLAEHVRRLRQGMKVMRYERIPPADELSGIVLQCLAANEHRDDAGIRLSAYVTGTGFIDAAGPVTLMCGSEPGAKKSLAGRKTTAMVTSWTRIVDNAMPGRLKSAANYQNGRLGLMQARDAGFDEAIFLTPEGKVAEGAGACIFMLRDGVPVTPPITAGILESVTRDTMLHLFAERYGKTPVERPIDRTELYVAEELFFCGSAYEVSPIVSVDGIPVGDGEIGPMTAGIWQAYEDLVRGRVPEHAEWRTPVYGAQDAAAAE